MNLRQDFKMVKQVLIEQRWICKLNIKHSSQFYQL